MRLKKSLNELCPKIACEVCDEKNQSTLHRHHLAERTELNTSNHPYNLGVLCSNCHNKIHAGLIKIVGVFPSTKPPAGRTLVFVDEKGICNVPGLENEKPYYVSKAISMKVYYPGEEDE